MNTLVTGGAGFIGSHLVRNLLSEGRQVLIADDFSRGKAENLLDMGISVKPRHVDLKDYDQTLEVMDGVESVFHLAARVGGVEFLHGSDVAELLALQANLVIDANVFRASLERGVRKLIYASSVAVYPIDCQQSQDVVLAEDHLKHAEPDGGYGWAKFLGEMQLYWMHGLDIGIARIFNIYGEGEEPDDSSRVVPALIRKAILYPREDFRVWGDGSQTRDFLYVADCVTALRRLEEKASFPPVVVNIGSGQPLSVRDLVEKIVEISGKSLKPIYDSRRIVGPVSRTADIRKATSLLGWEPTVSLEGGLVCTYRWVEKRLRRETRYSR